MWLVVELSGNEREDDLFNLLHEDDFSIGGVKVDINPIARCKTGTMEDYLLSVEEYLKGKWKKLSIKKRLVEKKKIEVESFKVEKSITKNEKVR